VEVNLHPFLNSPLYGESDQVCVASYPLHPVIEGVVEGVMGPQRRCGRDGELEYPRLYWYRIQILRPLPSTILAEVFCLIFTNKLQCRTLIRTTVSVENMRGIITGVPFIASLSSANLSHRYPASAGRSRDSCHAHVHDNRNICI